MADLTVDRLCKEYPTSSEPLIVLRDISMELSFGETLAVVGPSGSGKSTLLQILGTLDRPTSGKVQLQGSDPFSLSEPDLAQFRNERVGFIFQDHFLLPQLTAMENVLLPGLAQGAVPSELATHAEKLLDRVGLAKRRSHRPAELSGGERQRVAIARALLKSPSLILADEPTGNLDRTTADGITELLLELQRQDQHARMLIVVTHSPSMARRMQRGVELDAGQLRPWS